ncbi:MAG: helix-turn-helix domain-containing protein [Peptostreptococcaceae bacterium]
MAKLIDFNRIEGDEILFESNSLQSYGYGIISQYITKNPNISLQAKGVYSYLVSCAGNDFQTYPNQTTICSHLGIKKVDTLRKYLKELQVEGLIRIIKTTKKSLFYKNVYVIATDTRTIEIWKTQFENGIEFDEEEVLPNISKEKAPTSPKADADNKTIDNNIICENKENMPSELMENNIDDVEAKNKALMEQERKFVPSFDWRNE